MVPPDRYPGGTTQALTQTVADGDAGQRLDKWVAAHTPPITRTSAQALILEGHVKIDGTPAFAASRKLKAGETVLVTIPPAGDGGLDGELIPLQIAFEDAHLIVIDKPAGLVVHPSAGHETGTLVNALIAHCGQSLSGIGGVRRPGIVHRLDKDTSGLLVVAKTDAAHQGLSDQFAAHGADGRLQRTYRAIVWGTPLRPSGVIDAALARSTHNRTKIAITREGQGRHAVTRYRLISTFDGRDGAVAASLLELELETGRTHQIRVHLASLGHPVAGDSVYGAGFKTRSNRLNDEAKAALQSMNRQALHAAVLGFEHPITGQQLKFESALPTDMERFLVALTRP